MSPRTAVVVGVMVSMLSTPAALLTAAPVHAETLMNSVDTVVSDDDKLKEPKTKLKKGKKR